MLTQKLLEAASFDAQAFGSHFHGDLPLDQILRLDAALQCEIGDARTGETTPFILRPVGPQWQASFCGGFLQVHGMTKEDCLREVFRMFGHGSESTPAES